METCSESLEDPRPNEKRDQKRDDSHGAPSGTSLLQAIRCKYCSDPDNDDSCKMTLSASAAGIHVRVQETASSLKPGACPVQIRSTLVLEKKDITHCGACDELSALCSGVKELHIGGNALGSWENVWSILSAMPCLELLDLSQDSALCCADGPSIPVSPQFNCLSLRVLVFTGSAVPLSSVVSALQHLPCVKELYLSKNGYDDSDLTAIESSAGHHDGLVQLHLVENAITKWDNVNVLGALFPKLEILLLTSNPLEYVNFSMGIFEHLRSLNLNDTAINHWESVEELRKFPSLSELSLMRIPLELDLNSQKRRNSTIARLPSLLKLNKSSISKEERESAERWLLRQLNSNSSSDLEIYRILASKHGFLEPLADVDMSPQTHAAIEFHFIDLGRKNEVHRIALRQTVRQLKSWLGKRLELAPSKLKLFYLDTEISMMFGSEEMRYDSKHLHSYSMKDGDQIQVFHVQRK